MNRLRLARAPLRRSLAALARLGRGPHSSPDWLVLLALALATVLLAPQTVLLGKLPDHFDYWLQEYVHLVYLQNWLRAGELPLWNGQLVAGTPFLADPQTATLYPLQALPLLFLPAALVARLTIPLHFFLAGAFTYGLGRRLGLSRPGALAAGLAYSLAPHFAPLEVATYLQQSAVWLPAILWALHAGLSTGRAWPFVLAGLLWAVQLLRGYPQTWYVSGLSAVAYCLFEAISTLTPGVPRRRPPALALAGGGAARGWRSPAVLLDGPPAVTGAAPGARRSWATLAVGPLLFGAVGLGLGAAQLLPSLALLNGSQRGAGFSLAEAAGPGSVTLANLLGVAGPAAEVSGAFPGGVVLGLALAGLLYGRGTALWFFAGMAAVALGLCLGDRTPLWALAYRTVPGFTALHMPHRTLFAWSLSLALLAGYGLDGLARRPALRPLVACATAVGLLAWLATATVPGLPPEARQGALRLAAGLAVVLLGAVLFRLRRGPLAGLTGPALALLAGLDLLAYSAPRLYGHFYPPGPVYDPPPAARWLLARQAELTRAGDGPYRFASAVYQTPGVGEGSTLQDNRRLAYLPPNTSALYPGLDAAQGYLAIRREETGTLFGAINDLGRNARTLSVYDPRSRLLDVLGVRYFVADGANAFPSVVGGGRSLVLADGVATVPVRQPLATAALEVLSSLGDAAGVADGETVATVTLVATDGREWTLPLLAGEHTAEWLYDAPGQPAVRHRKAPVARATPRLEGGQAYVYRARFDLQPLGQPPLRELRLQTVDARARWNVDRVVLETPFSARFRLAYAAGDLHIWENPGALPRAWWTSAYVVAPDPASQLERLQDPAFPVGRVAVLGAPLPDRPPASPQELAALSPGQPAGSTASPPPTPPSGTAADKTGGPATVVAASANTRRIEVSPAAPALLVVSEAYAPGWRAWVDGRPAPLYQADGTFLAVPVRAGAHRVELRYLPADVVLGGAVSAATLLALALWAAGSRRWTGRRAPAVPEEEGGQPGPAGEAPGQPGQALAEGAPVGEV